MRRAFTLVELLVIVAIISTMVTVSVVNVRAGQTAARVRGATRDVLAVIRHARSVALVAQQPSVITYSSCETDGEVCGKIEVNTAKIFTGGVTKATTLSGEEVTLVSEPAVDDAKVSGEETGDGSAAVGRTVEEILFSPVSEDVFRGICLKVTKPDEQLGGDTGEVKRRFKVSVFSNVDYLLDRYKEARAKQSADSAAAAAGSADGGTAAAATVELQEPVSYAWQVNGRTEPHRVWIYAEGSTPEKGLSIRVDRFGAVRVLGNGEEEED